MTEHAEPTIDEVSAFYAEKLQHFADSTHWEGCWKDHWACAMKRVLSENKRLADGIEEICQHRATPPVTRRLLRHLVAGIPLWKVK